MRRQICRRSSDLQGQLLGLISFFPAFHKLPLEFADQWRLIVREGYNVCFESNLLVDQRNANESLIYRKFNASRIQPANDRIVG